MPKGALDAGKLQEFANEQKFDETAVALSVLCDLPIGFVERGLVQERSDLVLIFAKALGLDWETTRLILMLGVGTTDFRQKILRKCTQISKSSDPRQPRRQSASTAYGSNAAMGDAAPRRRNA